MEVGWLELRLQHMSCKSVDRYLEVEADDSRWLGSSRRWSSFPHVDTAFDGDAQHVEKWPEHLVIACCARDRAAFGDSWPLPIHQPNFIRYWQQKLYQPWLRCLPFDSNWQWLLVASAMPGTCYVAWKAWCPTMRAWAEGHVHVATCAMAFVV